MIFVFLGGGGWNGSCFWRWITSGRKTRGERRWKCIGWWIAWTKTCRFTCRHWSTVSKIYVMNILIFFNCNFFNVVFCFRLYLKMNYLRVKKTHLMAVVNVKLGHLWMVVMIPVLQHLKERLHRKNKLWARFFLLSFFYIFFVFYES